MSLEMYDFYRQGLFDELNNFNSSIFLTGICKLHYQLGKLSIQYRNKPTHLMLVEELTQVFSKYDCLPKKISISLTNHYSHRTLKKVLRDIGYRSQPKPNCKNFRAYLVN